MNKKERIEELEKKCKKLQDNLITICYFLGVSYDQISQHGMYFTQELLNKKPVSTERFDKNIDRLNSLIVLLGYEHKQDPIKGGWVKIKKK